MWFLKFKIQTSLDSTYLYCFLRLLQHLIECTSSCSTDLQIKRKYLKEGYADSNTGYYKEIPFQPFFSCWQATFIVDDFRHVIVLMRWSGEWVERVGIRDREKHWIKLLTDLLAMGEGEITIHNQKGASNFFSLTPSPVHNFRRMKYSLILKDFIVNSCKVPPKPPTMPNTKSRTFCWRTQGWLAFKNIIFTIKTDVIIPGEWRYQLQLRRLELGLPRPILPLPSSIPSRRRPWSGRQAVR